MKHAKSKNLIARYSHENDEKYFSNKLRQTNVEITSVDSKKFNVKLIMKEYKNSFK